MMSNSVSEQNTLKQNISKRFKQKKIWVGFSRWIKVHQAEKEVVEAIREWLEQYKDFRWINARELYTQLLEDLEQ